MRGFQLDVARQPRASTPIPRATFPRGFPLRVFLDHAELCSWQLVYIPCLPSLNCGPTRRNRRGVARDTDPKVGEGSLSGSGTESPGRTLSLRRVMQVNHRRHYSGTQQPGQDGDRAPAAGEERFLQCIATPPTGPEPDQQWQCQHTDPAARRGIRAAARPWPAPSSIQSGRPLCSCCPRRG